MRFFLIWWALLSGLYFLLVFKTEPAEIVAGVICGAISAAAADLVRRHGTVRLKLEGWGWLRAVAALPRHTVRDTWLLVGVLWRVIVRRDDVRGRFIALPFKGARGRSPEAAGRRAVAKLVGSVAPNTLVVGFASEKNRVLLHQLVDTGETPPCDPWEPGW
jgi:multisubunit Na+/H+ antiporter MnhE subunit